MGRGDRGLRAALDPPSRLARLLLGLVLGGVSIAFQVAGGLGVAPWSVLDQGIAAWAGIPVGTTSILVGAVVLMAWVPIGERVGIGTALNVVVIGVTVDVVLAVLNPPSSPAGQVAYMAVGVVGWGPASGLYIGAGLGPGPRDGLMTGLAARGLGSIRLVRTSMELVVLGIGWLLGGKVGPGTLVFALTIGPNIQFCLRILSLPRPRARSGAP